MARVEKGGKKFGEMGWVHVKLGFIRYGENLGFLHVIGNNCGVSIRGVS